MKFDFKYRVLDTKNPEQITNDITSETDGSEEFFRSDLSTPKIVD